MTTADERWTLRRGTAADLDAVRPLWLLIHAQHRQAAPDVGGYVSDDESWSVRRALYERILSSDDGILLLAEREGATVGYALAHVEATIDTWVGDTWSAGPRFGEIESLAVAESERGRGLASVLLDAIERELEERGVQDIGIGVVTGNDLARAIYERRGYRPAYTHLVRLSRIGNDRGYPPGG